MTGWLGHTLARREDERSALRRLRRLRNEPRGRPGRTRLFGAEFEYVDGRSLYAQFKEIFHRRVYDFHVADRSPSILDCGGNLGLAALRFRRCYPAATIRCIEADPEFAAILETNLRAQGDARTEGLAGAVWSEGGRMRFQSRGGDTGHLHPRGGIEVPCFDIADLCSQRVDLLKLDIEGAEGEVLRRLVASGASERVGRIVCEWHERGAGASALPETLEGLFQAGFTTRVFAGASSPDIDADPALSGFAAVPFRGATLLIYAWRPLP